MSVKSGASFGEATAAATGGGEVVRVGYLKKLKTMRKKYFVLRAAETVDTSSRLEYYDNDKKYKQGQQPKRSISLMACFNINRRVDTKHKHVIALYTKDDCFCVVLDTEKDLDEWLKALLSLQHGEDVVDGEPPKPTFEHVWQVTMLNKGLGSTRNIIGPYHLCFTDKTLSLVRKSTTGMGALISGGGGPTDQIEFSLMSIRRCGHSECFFYMEVGRSAITGAGELWMQTEDTYIAQIMGDIILRAMSNNNNKEDLGPKPRIRSSSANEASKPILMQRRQTHCGQKSTSYCSPGTNQDGVSSTSSSQSHNHNQCQNQSHVQDASSSNTVGYSNISTQFSSTQHPSTTGIGGRERCDSMPSRARTSSEGTPAAVGAHPIRSHLAPHRPTSFYGHGRDISHSPPAGSPVSPASAACSTDSAGSSLSIDEPDAWPDYSDPPLSRYGHSLTPDEPIVEEEYVQHSPSPITGYVPMAPLSSDDGYVDMSPRGGGGRTQDMSPAASSCSITSGTPSTDMRFSEYHLEKVTSYFTPSEEDDSSERPHRAYSVGSRPDVFKNDARVRAFSVGSRRTHNRVLPPHGPPAHSGQSKSSSAPILSQNSMERMDDLMEMDFSKPITSSITSLTTSGYVDMSPRQRTTGYVEMKPGSGSADQSPDYIDMRATSSSPHKNKYHIGTSPKNNNKTTSSPIQEEYMDMDFRGAATQSTQQSTNQYMEMTPRHNNNNNNVNDDYMNMSLGGGKKKPKKQRSQPIAITPQPHGAGHKNFAVFLQQKTSPHPPPPNYLALAHPLTQHNNQYPEIFPFSPGSPQSQNSEYVNFCPAAQAEITDKLTTLNLSAGAAGSAGTSSTDTYEMLKSTTTTTTRPSSSGSLHYASLDLIPAADGEGDAGTKSPTPSLSEFTYAEIDFVKSLNKVRH